MKAKENLILTNKKNELQDEVRQIQSGAGDENRTHVVSLEG